MADTPVSPALFQPQEAAPTLYEQPAAPNVVPKNTRELAAQVASVDETQLSIPFADRFSSAVRNIEQNGARPIITDVALREREEHMAALRQNAVAEAAKGNTVGLQGAAGMIQDAQQKMAEPPTLTEANTATARRALESVGITYASNLYDSWEKMDKVVQKEGDLLSLRNVVAHESARLEGQTGMWDRITHFFTAFLPFVHDYRVNRAISKETGIDRYFDTEGAVNDFRSFFRGLGPDERLQVVKHLADAQVGAIGENKAGSMELLRKLSEMSKSDANVDLLFNGLAVTDVAQLTRGLFNLVRSGTPVKALFNVAGSKPAAELSVADLLTRTGATGLDDAELMAKALAFGKNPLDLDPAKFAGLSADMQRVLREGFDGLLAQSHNRLISSGLTAEEIAAGQAEIHAKYHQQTNQAVHSVIFGEGDELGQRMTVFWQAKDGKAFLSKEAADAYARAEGMIDYTVVPKNAANNSAMLSMTLRDVATTSGELDLLKILKGNRDKIDSVFNRMVTQGHADPLTSQIADVWRAAAKTDKDLYPSAQHFLKIIAKQSDDEAERFIAQHLLDAGTAKGVRWDKLLVKAQVGGMDAGGYWQNLDYVILHVNHLANPEVMLHEFVHAHNAQVISLIAGDRARAAKVLSKEVLRAGDDLIDLHQRLNTWYKKKAGIASFAEQEQRIKDFIFSAKGIDSAQLESLLKLPQELITYGVTNPEIRKWLQSIKLSELGYKSSDTVWSMVWDSFKRMFGWKADDTALAKIMQTHEGLTSHVNESARTDISTRYRAGHVDDQYVEGLVGDSMLSAKGKSTPIDKAIEKEISKENKKLGKASETEREAIVQRIQALREAAASKGAANTPAGPTGEYLVRERRMDPLSNSNIGKFSEEDIRSMPWIAVDPKHGASELAVEQRVIGVHAEAKTKRDLTSYLTPFFDKLSGAGKARVKAVLEEGDAVSNGGVVGKEFSFGELRGKGLNEAEAAAYFASRQVRMVSYHLRNAEMVRALRAEGMKEIQLLTPGYEGQKYAGRIFATKEEAGPQALGKAVYDYTNGRAVLLDSEKLESAYNDGQRIVQFRQPVEFDGKRYYHAIVDDSTAKARDIHTALNYRPGEFSRIYTDQYFITVRKMVEVDGKNQEVKETVRTAASPREAQEYVDAHRKAIELFLGTNGTVADRELEKLIGKYTSVDAFKKEDWSGFSSMDFHYTRNAEEYLNGSISEAMTNGRLFTSKREGKLLSVDADRNNIKDVFQSLEHEISNVSRVANIGQWRQTTIQRWMNTFGHMLPNRTGNDVADFMAAAGSSFTKGSADAQFAERTHAYIMRQIGVRTSEERFYEGVTRSITEKLFTGNERIESIGAKLRTMKWIDFIRNANFNLNLGMLNPAQLLVQANGATTALILSPVHGAKAAMTFPLLRMALMSDNPDVWRRFAAIEKFKNLGLSDTGEFVDLVQAVRKTGIIDNVRSTALWNKEDGALNVFGGYPSRVFKSNTAFFNRGEEFSRVVSFDVARREWMAKNPGKLWNSDEALKQIVVRMDDLTQNMTKANLARFQEGILSIPLQFAQYNIKLAANVMTSAVKPGRGFTRAEAIQLMLGHIALYGAAGSGLVWAMDEVLGNNVKDKLGVDTKNLLAQGMVSWGLDQVHQAFTGEHTHVALGSRLGSFNYYEQLAEAAFTDKTKVWDALLGPTVSSVKRLGTIGEVAGLWRKDPDLTLRDVLEGLGTMGSEQVASLRNWTKAYLYMQHQGKMLDRNGVAIAQLNGGELLWQALGFQPTAAVDVNNLIKSKHDHAKAIDDIAHQVLRVQRDIITDLNTGNFKRAEERKKLLQALLPDNAGDLMEVQTRVRDRLFPYDTEMQKLLGDYVWKGNLKDKPVIVTEQPRKVQ